MSFSQEKVKSSLCVPTTSSTKTSNAPLSAGHVKLELLEEDEVVDKPETAETVLTAAKSYLDCPVCYDTLVSPIYQCQNGHIICNNCIEKLAQCGECRVTLAGARIRNVALENICKSVDVKCPNRGEGCEVRTTVELLKSHLEVCGFQ